VLYTYVHGNEYEDIAAAWDWSLLPGITVDYGQPFPTQNAEKMGGLESFVGGASTGSIGVSAMRYTNPATRALSFRKAWFFLPNGAVHVSVANVSSSSNSFIISVLDQKRHNGTVYINDKATDGNVTGAIESLWHDGIGYTFELPEAGGFNVSFATGNRHGAWSSIGTSTQPPVTVDLFSAWIAHDRRKLSAPFAYTAFPGTMSLEEFKNRRASSQVRTLANDAHVSAIQDDASGTTAAVFWDPSGGTVTVSSTGGPFTLSSNAASVVIYVAGQANLTVADPSQSLQEVDVTLALGTGARPASWGGDPSRSFRFTLPSGPGGKSGSSLTQSIA
jgi:hypothetical protein